MSYCKLGVSVHVSTNLRGEVSPFCNSLVVHSDASNSTQNDVLGNLHSKTSHTRDEDIGVLHALHSIMAQHVTRERKYHQLHRLKTSQRKNTERLSDHVEFLFQKEMTLTVVWSTGLHRSQHHCHS